MSGEYNPPPEGNPSFLARRNRFGTALVKFIGKRTSKCREVVRILSQSMDSKLSLIMRIKLRLHYLICAWCQRYDKVTRVAQFHVIGSESLRRLF